MAAERQVQLGQLPVVPNGSTVGDQFIEKPGEELIQDLRTARQQNMDMPTLRYPSSDSGIVRQHVPLDDSDGVKEIGQDPRGKQSAHARPENDRALTQLWHGETPASKSDVSSLADQLGRNAVASAAAMRASKPAAAALARCRSKKSR